MPDRPDAQAARRFLLEHLGRDVGPVTLVGEGAWSRCFGFDDAGRALVVRFGRHRGDFEKDRCAAAFRDRSLPVPEVLEIGRAFGGWFAISSRAHGAFLESLAPGAWRAALPAVVALLDALRTADLSGTSGWGCWAARGEAPHASWSDFLLAVDADAPEQRTHGWRARLAASPLGDGLFRTGHARLADVARGLPATRHLVHADLVNRNVLVADGRVTAVLDWGCSLFGDFLYDLAWLEFWSPWHPGLAAVGIRDAAWRHLRERRVEVPAFEARLHACGIHIGLDHLAYHAFTGDDDALRGTATRLEAWLAGAG